MYFVESIIMFIVVIARIVMIVIIVLSMQRRLVALLYTSTFCLPTCRLQPIAI